MSQSSSLIEVKLKPKFDIVCNSLWSRSSLIIVSSKSPFDSRYRQAAINDCLIAGQHAIRKAAKQFIVELLEINFSGFSLLSS